MNEKIDKYTILHEFVFNDLIRDIGIGKIKPKYYTDEDKIPSKYTKYIGLLYEFEDRVLIEIKSRKKVLKNKLAGNDKKLIINGNLLHDRNSSFSGFRIKNFQIIKIKQILLEYFRSKIKDIKLNEDILPIRINFLFELKNLDIDIDNLKSFYEKEFLDASQKFYIKKIGLNNVKITNKNGFLLNDNPKNINSIYSSVKISDSNKLTVQICKEHE